MECEDDFGLSSLEAARRLKIIIKDEIAKCQHTQKYFGKFASIFDVFLKNTDLPLDWFWALLLLAQSSVLLAGYFLGDGFRGSAPFIEGLAVSILSIWTLVLCLRETHLFHTELERSLMEILDKRQNCFQHDSFLDIRSRDSPAITIVWTYRDKQLVNLPWNLLVEGDCIVLGPSEVAPAHVRQIVNDGYVPICLDAGEVFNPPNSSTKDGIEESAQPAECFPYLRQRFLVLEAPIKRCVRSVLQHGYQRPQSILNHDMKKIMMVLRKKVIWFFLISSLFVNYVRLRLEPTTVGHYSEIMLLATGYVIIPLTPVVFPTMWIFSSFFGVARIQSLFDHPLNEKKNSYPSTIKQFWHLVKGDPSCLPRTANLLHTLGNVTVFCCVDKVGVLCYPNLAPGNVFLFKDILAENEKEPTTGQESSGLYEKEVVKVTTSAVPLDVNREDKIYVVHVQVLLNINCETKTYNNFNKMTFEADQTEVLNISYDFQACDRIQFDDGKWKDYIESLKPLGLNIILNSSCSFPLKNLRHSNFTGHVSLAANSSPIPYIRRCLCPLAKMIGFEDKVADRFVEQQKIFSFRPVHSSELSYVKSNLFLSIVKEKPVPNMLSVIVREKASGMLQLLSQGSADIVLDSCSDFWNGDDLCELSAYDRRKVLDFYHRMRTTGHCVAFSYRPLIEDLACRTGDIFVEYPPSAKFSSCQSDVGSSLSFSRLFMNEDAETQVPKKPFDATIHDLMETSTDCEGKDVTSACRLLNKQIFIGIVTLNDFVNEDIACLVENLNNGGIRFVYFSYENELRSRVFAERLGLETGWNCHISLGSYANDLHANDENLTSSYVSETDELLNSSKSNIAQVHYIDGDVKFPTENQGVCDSNGRIDASSDDEDFYFIPNRAKLPRGIRNIRPHLKHVDDVPLLVPLFTDCSPQAITDMIEIMQENGEVVCCLGSSLNIWNCHIFAQADVSISVDPLQPRLCLSEQSGNSPTGQPCDASDCKIAAANQSLKLSAILNSMPCSFSCESGEKVKFISVICEARRLMLNTKNCFVFLMSCSLSLSFTLLVSFCLLLPLPMTGLQLLWLTVVILPILALSLIGTPADAGLMSQMTGKRISNIYDVSKHYLIQFLPTFGLNSLFTVVGVFGWMLFSFCTKSHGASGNCHFLFGAKNISEPWHGWTKTNLEGLLMSQDLVLFFTTVYFVVLSASFVHKTSLIWKKSPFENKPWVMAAACCLLLQAIYTSVSLHVSNLPGITHNFYAEYVTFPLLMAALWPIVLVMLSELMKKRFMRMNVRFQKRERLKFDTKLGMNSPV